MAITIVATSGSATANSYATETEFAAYAATLTVVPASTTVTGSTCTETEKKAMVMAFRVFNNLAWQAQRTDSTQSGSWPQRYCLDPDAPSVTGLSDIAQLYYDDTEVPTRVKNGQIELALAIVTGGTTDILAVDPNAGVIEKAVDVLNTRWQPYQRATGLSRYPQVLAYIGPMLASTAGSLEIARS